MHTPLLLSLLSLLPLPFLISCESSMFVEDYLTCMPRSTNTYDLLDLPSCINLIHELSNMTDPNRQFLKSDNFYPWQANYSEPMEESNIVLGCSAWVTVRHDRVTANREPFTIAYDALELPKRVQQVIDTCSHDADYNGKGGFLQYEAGTYSEGALIIVAVQLQVLWRKPIEPEIPWTPVVVGNATMQQQQQQQAPTADVATSATSRKRARSKAIGTT